MDKIYDYMNENKENKLTIEQFGLLNDNQKIDTPFKELERCWKEKEKELLA
jgi:hypothetical protein